MSVKLIRPGTRHGNKVYYARIAAKGKRVEISTGTANPRLAKRYAEEVEKDLFERDLIGGTQTLDRAIDDYIAFRRPRKLYEGYLLRIKALIGNRTVERIGQADFDECARVLYPGLKNSTWDTCVYTPLQATIRHAGRHIVVTRPEKKKPRNRSLTAKQRDIVLANCEGRLGALLTVLFFNGPRISEALSLHEDRVDLPNGLAGFDLTKNDKEHWRPLHQRSIAALASLDTVDGRYFPWTRSTATKYIAALSRKVGIRFSAHWCRHTFADLFMERGGSLRDLMDAGGWESAQAAMRYTHKRVERVRKAVNKL